MRTTAAWANSATANTEVTKDASAFRLSLKNVTVLGGSDAFTASIDVTRVSGTLLLFTIRNPSSVTALTCEVQIPYNDPNGGTPRYSKLTSFTAAVTSSNAGGESFLVEGL